MRYNLMAHPACPICKGMVHRASAVARIIPDGSFGWENDSTLELIGLKEAEAFVCVCVECCHAIRMPVFDTAKLYGPRATEIRRAHFQRYYPDQAYGEASAAITYAAAFERAAREFYRFQTNSAFLSNSIVAGELKKDIHILDWGGGDGNVAALHARALELATGVRATVNVYDPAPRLTSGGDIEIAAEVDQLAAHYDVIILSHVLEHTHDPVGMLRETCGRLVDGGLLIVEVPDERMNYMRCLFRRPFPLHYHVGWFTARSLHRALSAAEFGGIATRYQYGSAYHGLPMTSLIAVCTKGLGNGRGPHSTVREVCSFILLAARKTIGRLLAKWIGK
jgi:hypothetical protein